MKAKDWIYKPNIVQIELVQGCNRRCHFCGTMGMERGIHKAELKTIYHTCELINRAELNCRILLAGHGEPTLHPEAARLVKAVRTILPKNMIHMFTNGTVIQKMPELVAQLFDAGLNDLIFDEYADSPIGAFVRSSRECQRYEIVELRPGTPLFAEKNAKRQRICVTPPIDLDEKNAARKLCNHCGAGRPQLKESNGRSCAIIFRDFFVRWDGNIAICCNDFRGEYPVTNILRCKTFEEAYFHPRLESARKLLMQKDRRFHPCDVCDVKPIRPGLLPDARGQVDMPLPTEEDRKRVNEKHVPLARIVRRPWEEE